MARRSGHVLIADIRGWTAFTDEHGDEAASALARKFADVADEGVQAWRGRVVELRGDEGARRFRVRARRTACGGRASGGVRARRTLDRPSLPLLVGIGLDAGEAVSVGDGFRGAALNVAARLCSLAAASETIATQSLCQLAGPLPDLDFSSPYRRTSWRGPPARPITAVRVESDGPAGPGARPDRVAGRAGASIPDGHAACTSGPGDGRQPPLRVELEAVVPLAGRSVELHSLELARGGAPATARDEQVVISGQPGIGKTRLAAELAARAHADGATVTYFGATGDTDALTRALAETGRKLVIVDRSRRRTAVRRAQDERRRRGLSTVQDDRCCS